MTAQEWYERGNEFRRNSDWQHAIECYNHATEIDPTSPAAKAREMLNNILNYYCKEMYNP
jgi:outer membrane protein assembly factor BamD (BamD/ComL family)